MKHTTNTAQRAASRRRFAAVVIAAGLALAGCADNSSNAPGAPSPGNPPVTAATWARSMCAALHPAFSQLVQMRTNLTDAAAQLGAADPDDSAAIGQAFGAAGNVIRLIGVLATDPELRAAIDQTPECQSLAATSGRW